MRDRHSQQRPLPTTVREKRIGHLDPRRHHVADKMQRPVPNQRARQQTDLAKNLEPVANTDDQRSASRRVYHALHDGRKSGDGAAAEIIAVGKSARQHDRVETID